MVKYASRFEFVVYLHDYKILDWGNGQAGLYLKNYKNGWQGRALWNPNKVFKTGTPLAASGTREELEAFVKELSK